MRLPLGLALRAWLFLAGRSTPKLSRIDYAGNSIVRSCKDAFYHWTQLLDPASIVDEVSGLTAGDIAVIASMLEVSLIIPPLTKIRS